MMIVGFLLPMDASARIKERVQVPPNLVNKFNLVLKIYEALHTALISQNDALIETQLQAFQLAVDDTLDTLHRGTYMDKRSIASKPFMHEKNLTDMFKSMRKYLVGAQVSYGTNKRTHLRELLRQVVFLTKQYNISHPFKTYFCNKDRSTWLQRSGKIKNPILTSTDPNCGIVVK
jgi:hypothetical protein